MISLPASVRVYLCLSPCDMRKSFDSLHALVRDHLELDALAGHLFVFRSRRADRVKILYWDRDGFALWAKRLEEGTFAWPAASAASNRRREITAPETALRRCPRSTFAGPLPAVRRAAVSAAKTNDGEFAAEPVSRRSEICPASSNQPMPQESRCPGLEPGRTQPRSACFRRAWGAATRC